MGLLTGSYKEHLLCLGLLGILNGCGQDRAVEKRDLVSLVPRKPQSAPIPKKSLPAQGLNLTEAKGKAKSISGEQTYHNRVVNSDGSPPELKLMAMLKSPRIPKRDAGESSGYPSEGLSAKAAGLLIYGLYMSTSPDCFDPKLVFSSSNPEYVLFSQDRISLPTGTLDPGMYACMILDISDQFKFIPAKGFSDVCLENQEYIVDLCPNGVKTLSPESGKEAVCTDKEDRVAVYFSIKSNSTGVGSDETAQLPGNPLTPPSDNLPEDGLKLSKSFFMHNMPTSTLLQLDLTGRIARHNGKCVSMFPLLQLIR